MPIVRWEKEETVAVLTMDNGPNLNNLDFFSAMNQAFEEILEDEEINALVVTASDPKSWNTGLDLEWISNVMMNNDQEVVQAFYDTFTKLLAHFLLSPFPIVAAITGHAFANGGVWACACDFRFMREDKGFFCFPEIDVNVPFGPGVIDVLQKAIPRPFLDKMIFTGKRYTARELEENGVIEAACENAEETLKAAVGFAKTFQKKRTIFFQHKKILNAGILEKVDFGFWQRKENQV